MGDGKMGLKLFMLHICFHIVYKYRCINIHIIIHYIARYYIYMYEHIIYYIVIRSY